jgi:hypothetical protein
MAESYLLGQVPGDSPMAKAWSVGLPVEDSVRIMPTYDNTKREPRTSVAHPLSPLTPFFITSNTSFLQLDALSDCGYNFS